MRIDNSIKQIPWPEPFEAPITELRIALQWPVVKGEKLLLATIQRNRSKKRWSQPTADFRLVCSKKQEAAAILYQGERIGKRIGLERALRGLGFWANSDYPEISERDEKALAKWLGINQKKSSNHMIPELCNWVDDAISKETQRQKDARGELRDEDVRLCPEELPEGIVEYIRRTVLPEDNVLIYKPGNVRGTCFQCREKVRAVGGQRFRQHEYTTCPNCGSKVVGIRETSDAFSVDYVQNIVSLQLGTDGKTVFLRQWHLKRDHTAQWEDIPSFLEETTRYAIRGNRVAKWQMENKENYYYVAYRYRYSDWHRIESVSVVYDGQYYFHLPGNWREQIAGTSLQYCNIGEYVDRAVNYTRSRNPVRFLLDWVRYPAIEKFWKAGYERLVHDRICGLSKETQYIVRWHKNSIKESLQFPTRLLKIHPPEKWNMFDAAKVTVLWRQAEAGEIRETDIPELARSLATLDDIRDAVGHASIHRILKYLGQCVDKEREQRKRDEEEARKQNRSYWASRPFETHTIYRDYLKDCIKLKLDLDDKAVLFPPDLPGAHQRTIAMVKHNASRLSREAFQREVERLSWMAWEKDGLMIRLPVNGDEIVAEGKALHHCVGGYVERMANGKTAILFIRRIDEPDTPFFTLEWLNGKVQQCKTLNNGDYTKNAEVNAFIDKWVKTVASKGGKKKKQAQKAA